MTTIILELIIDLQGLGHQAPDNKNTISNRIGELLNDSTCTFKSHKSIYWRQIWGQLIVSLQLQEKATME